MKHYATTIIQDNIVHIAKGLFRDVQHKKKTIYYAIHFSYIL